ncbi:NAD(P)H-dependent oxidoreductase [Lentilactobacillus sp. Marseille-Q4993]|uniref:flavodoxin family protein n=1 Tax=Lentilactobacillus sp. Marseille-Q4993 TaxID=3039492 RepID=UPI0024BD02C0|nr:NAD(P)H-dependent oxidoreductase [Lentilactobacillus sp. Marseille-Q4993]
MKILGILGSHLDTGVTAMTMNELMSHVQQPNTYEVVYLENYDFKPDIFGKQDPVLDKLEQKMLESDVWVIGAPTYWGNLAGQMKDFFDCMRQRLVRFDHTGGTHPDRFKDKHYLSFTNCYTGEFENFVTGVTDQTFRTIDKVMTAAGVIKIGEFVVPGTYGMKELPAKKKRICEKYGNKLNNVKKRDDSTMKRYIELFVMICVMALITMLIQLGLGLLPKTDFFTVYISFALIFFILLACILHFMTFVKHRRR